MISSEVQRTLVKSPPELWAELSDPTALARHLGELGEIRITRVEPEKLVEWEAEGTTGTVAIKASGWGTKVTLTVSRELSATTDADAPDAAAVEEAAEPAEETQTSPDTTGLVETNADAKTSEQQQPVLEPAPAAADLNAWASQAAESERPMITASERFAHDDPEPLLGGRLLADAPLEDEPECDESPAESTPRAVSQEPVQSEPRRGLFARLFGRRRRQVESTALTAPDTPEPTAATPIAEPSHEPSAVAPAVTAAEPAPTIETPAEQPEEGPHSANTGLDLDPAEPEAPSADAATTEEAAPGRAPADLSAELKQAEEIAAEKVTAVLTCMLDRLGAAHHRPFSRS